MKYWTISPKGTRVLPENTQVNQYENKNARNHENHGDEVLLISFKNANDLLESIRHMAVKPCLHKKAFTNLQQQITAACLVGEICSIRALDKQ